MWIYVKDCQVLRGAGRPRLLCHRKGKWWRRPVSEVKGRVSLLFSGLFQVAARPVFWRRYFLSSCVSFNFNSSWFQCDESERRCCNGLTRTMANHESVWFMWQKWPVKVTALVKHFSRRVLAQKGSHPPPAWRTRSRLLNFSHKTSVVG